jgi:hypothetical protein
MLSSTRVPKHATLLPSVSTTCGNEGIAIHGGGIEAEGFSIKAALASGYIHKYAK